MKPSTCCNQCFDRGAYPECTCTCHTTNNWRDALQFEVMEDYLIEAELTQFARDPVEHKERMRAHWDKLVAFVAKSREEAKEEAREEFTVKLKEAIKDTRTIEDATARLVGIIVQALSPHS